MSTTKNPRDLNPKTAPQSGPLDTSEQNSIVDAAVRRLLEDIDRNRVRLGPLMPVASVLKSLDAQPVIGRAHLIEAIVREPCAVALLLRAANSRYWDPVTGGIVSVETSVDVIGERGIREVIQYLATEVPERWAWDAAPQHLRKMWTNTIYTALAARNLAARTGVIKPVLAYACAMLHNIGEPLLIQYISREANGIELLQPPYSTAGHVIASCHQMIGARVLESWNIPQTIVRCARHHHETVDDGLHAVIVAAWQAALRYGYVYLGAHPDTPLLERVMHQLGQPMRVLDQITEDIAMELNQTLAKRS